MAWRPETEARLVASARRLVDSGLPWSAIGIRQVTEGAGLTRTAFYDVLESKAELLELVTRPALDQLVASFQAVAASIDDDTATMGTLTLLLELWQSEGQALRVHAEVAQQDPAVADEAREVRDLCMAALLGGSDDAAARAQATVTFLATERTLSHVVQQDVPVSEREALLAALASLWRRTIDAAR